MEKMEGKTESLEIMNMNNGWLIIELKPSLVQHLIFLEEGLHGKDGG